MYNIGSFKFKIFLVH